MANGIKIETHGFLFYFGVSDASPEASKDQLRSEKSNIVLHILQLHRMKKQQDEDQMKKGARDGKAEVYPDVDREAIAFALNFTLVTFFVSRQRK